MENLKIKVSSLNPENFEFQKYLPQDIELLNEIIKDYDKVSSNFKVEYHIFDNTLNYIDIPDNILKSFKLRNDNLYVDPSYDLQQNGFISGNYHILYSFYKPVVESKLWISEISSDRTELRINLENYTEVEISLIEEFINYRKNSSEFVDFYLNFGKNKTYIANNIVIDYEGEFASILVKLYQPLPEQISLKSKLEIVEKLYESLLYKVEFSTEYQVEDEFKFISGPNFNEQILEPSNGSTQEFNYASLFGSDLQESTSQLKSLLKEKGIKINVDYNDFSKFVHFGSAKSRIENFIYKVGLIESYKDIINTDLGQVTSNTKNTAEFLSNKALYESKIDDIITNFDGFEHFMYFTKDNPYSYPKSTATFPYELKSVLNVDVLTWLGSTEEDNPYYGGLLLEASNYDENNQNYLYWSIPEYLREDEDNQNYLIYLNMLGHYYDGIWVYMSEVPKKWDTDNRINFGISKDLVKDFLKDLGVKLYSNQIPDEDLYLSFLGVTPDGNTYPINNITDTLPVGQEGIEYISDKVDSSSKEIPLNEVNTRLYKRIFHNLPYLLKSKGTVNGLRAIINLYGIPSTILDVKEYGGGSVYGENIGEDIEEVTNYSLDIKDNSLTTSFETNLGFNPSTATPKTVQFRFKTDGIPTNNKQLLFSSVESVMALVLEYNGNGNNVEAYSGAIEDPQNKLGTLKFYPDLNSNPSTFMEVTLPFFNQEWFSVQIGIENVASELSTLRVAYKEDGKIKESSTQNLVSGVDFDYNYWTNSITQVKFSTTSSYNLGGNIYYTFEGKIQEVRYYTSLLGESQFKEFTLNPLSISGLVNASDELIFRAPLGTIGDYTSNTSVHPKIGVIDSFTNDSIFTLNSSTFVLNTESIYKNTLEGGLKNIIVDKVRIEKTTDNFPNGEVLSNASSLQQYSKKYNDGVDYVEVAFSPQNDINKDIISHFGNLNIGEYIGDVRQIYDNTNKYSDLDKLSNEYFEKYISSSNWLDYVRVIKYLDGSLFKMVKDFVPASTTLNSGVVIKPHILERNRQKPVIVESKNDDIYEADIQNSFDKGESRISNFSGGTAGIFQQYNNGEFETKNPEFLQSKTYIKEGPLGKEIITDESQVEFYNGELENAVIELITDPSEKENAVYLKNPKESISLAPIFFFETINGNEDTVVKREDFLNGDNSPKPGFVWFYAETSIDLTSGKVLFIKLPVEDLNGVNIFNSVDGLQDISFKFEGQTSITGISDGVYEIKKYNINGINKFANNILLFVGGGEDQNYFNDPNGGTENWNVSSSTSAYGNAGGNALEGLDLSSQGHFYGEFGNQTQFFRYYNGGKQDALVQFNTGSDQYINSSQVFDENNFYWGSYSLERTPNIPLNVSCSFNYSASSIGDDIQTITTLANHQNGAYYNTGSSTLQSVTNVNGGYLVAPINQDSIQFGTPPVANYTHFYDPLSYLDRNLHAEQRVNGKSGALIAKSPMTSSVTWEHDYLLLGGSYVSPISGYTYKALKTVEGLPLFTSNSLTNTISQVSFALNTDGGTASINAPIAYFDDKPTYKINSTQFRIKYRVNFTYGEIWDLPEDRLPSVRLAYKKTSSSTWNYGIERNLVLSNNEAYVGSGINNDGGFDEIIEIDDANLGEYEFRLEVGGYSQTTYTYYVENFTVGLQYTEITIINFIDPELEKPISKVTFVSNKTYLVQTSQATDVSKATLSFGVSYPSNYTLGTITPYLNISGSAGKRDIGVGVGVYDQLNFGMVEFPDAKLNSISRTTSTNYEIHYIEITNVPAGSSLSWSNVNFTSQTSVLDDSYLEVGMKLLIPIKVGDSITSNNGVTYNTLDTSASKTLAPTTMDDGDVLYSTYVFDNIEIEDSNLLNITFVNTSLAFSNFYPKISTLNTINNIIATGYSSSFQLCVFRGSSENPTNGYNISQGQYLVLGTGSINAEGTGTYNFVTSDIGTDNRLGKFLNYKHDDVYILGMIVDKQINSNLAITNLDFKIYPAENRIGILDTEAFYYGNSTYGTGSYGGVTRQDGDTNSEFGVYTQPYTTETYISEFFGDGVISFSRQLDYQPLLNNFVNYRESIKFKNLEYLDYNNYITLPAHIQDSNYDTIGWIGNRYIGCKAEGSKINEWRSNDIGTYGKLPVLEIKDTYFGYFSSISDLYPLLNGTTQVKISHVIDIDGNALPPSLNEISKDVFSKIYSPGKKTKLASKIDGTNNEVQNLNDKPIEVLKLGKTVVPVLYSQNSSKTYSNLIEFEGLHGENLYDTITNTYDYSFNAQGSITTPTISDDGKKREFSMVINPTEDYLLPTYSTSSYSNGVITYPAAGIGEINQYHLTKIEVTIPTTFISSADYYRAGNFWRSSKRKEYTELNLKLGLSKNGSLVPFDPTDLKLRVWKNGESTDLGSVKERFSYDVDYTKGYNFWSDDLKLDSNNQLSIQINENAVEDLLNAKGINNHETIEKLEWVISATSGRHNLLNYGDILKWETTGSVLIANNGTNTFFPDSSEGSAFISQRGERSHEYENSNSLDLSSDDIFTFGKNINAGTSDGNDYLWIKSELVNRVYGDEFTQKQIQYTPGASSEFPTGSEPVSASIGKTYGKVEFKVGDEIRFANNENYSYRIEKVFSPSENIYNGKGYAKVKVDRPVPASINKKFFIVRRYLESNNNVVINYPFPYTVLGDDVNSYSSGVLYPQFPSDELVSNTSKILSDLSDKKIIN